jgi:predicted phosphodiesterase
MLTYLMRLLVLSDIHADARALEAVLADSASLNWDQVLLLGDLIGYGTEPGQTVSVLRSLPLRAAIRGNHETMLLQLLHGDPVAASSDILTMLARHAEQLSDGNLEFLAGLPETHVEAGSGWQLAHGSPRRHDEYVLSSATARASSASLQQPVCFIGHTHVPAAFHAGEDGRWRARSFSASETAFRLPEGSRAFLNPGSFLLVREGAGGSSYGIYDEENREFLVRRLALE